MHAFCFQISGIVPKHSQTMPYEPFTSCDAMMAFA